MASSRPIMRYHGGKWLLAPWIIENMPAHRIYTESFGGGASVLIRKERAYAEVYNDLDSQIVNVFRVARDHGEKLKELLYLTPFAREEFQLAYFPDDCPIEQARRTIARSFMGYGSSSATQGANKAGGPSTGFRANSNRSGTTPAGDWKNYAEVFDRLIDRLRGVVIENRDAKEVMAAHDGPTTLHYVDPPYVLSTRSDSRADYRYEMDDSDHIALADFLKTLKGAVMVSGYSSPLYESLFEGWHRTDRRALADGAAERVETLWISPWTPWKPPVPAPVQENLDLGACS